MGELCAGASVPGAAVEVRLRRTKTGPVHSHARRPLSLFHHTRLSVSTQNRRPRDRNVSQWGLVGIRSTSAW